MDREKPLSVFIAVFLFCYWFSGIASANVIHFSESLNPKSYTYRSIVVEPSDASVTITIARGSGDIDLYVKKAAPAQGGTSSEIKQDSDFASESQSWHESVTIDSSTSPALSPGKWYVTIVNYNSYPVTVDVTVSSQASSTSSSGGATRTGGARGSNPHFRPQVGLWYNKAKPGHGVDIEQSGTNLAAVWYTYNPDRTPTWYLAIGPYSGQRSWTATLNKYHWNGSSATPNPVGTITLEFRSRTKATFRWKLNGQTGSEPLERFRMADHVPESNLTGLWYNSSEPGYGYSIDTQGNTVAIVAYFYDSNGKPRWALNSSHGPVSSTGTVPAMVFFGPCPNCSSTNFNSASAGSITRNFSGTTKGTIGLNITLPAPMNSSWSKPPAGVTLLSSKVNNQELDLEMAVDEITGVFSDTGDMFGGLTDSFSSIDLSNIQSSTCPRITYGDLSHLSLAGPMHIPLKVDFGAGCSDSKGNTWSGSINAPINATLGSSSMHLDTNVTVHNLKKNGQFLGSGTTSVVINLASSGSSNLSSGTGNINLNLAGVEHEPLTGKIGLQFNNINLAPMLGMGSSSGGSTLSSLLKVVGSGGSIGINLNNLVYGQDSISGTISVSGQSAGTGRLDLNLRTNRGPVSGSFMVRQGSSSGTAVITTISPATVLDYQVTMNNVIINPDACTDAPVGGSMVVSKGGKSGRFTFDGSCLGYAFTGL